MGKKLKPKEELYFRQDLPPDKQSSCLFKQCWHPPTGVSAYCSVHVRVIKDECIEHFTAQLSNLHPHARQDLNKKITRNCHGYHPEAIDAKVFFNCLDSMFTPLLTVDQKRDYVEAFNLRSEGNYRDLLVSKLLSLITSPVAAYNTIRRNA